MTPHSEKIRKEIQKIIYGDLDLWKQHINDLDVKKIDVNAFKQHYVEFLQKIEDNIANFTLFFLKKESHSIAQGILGDNLEKTAMLETVTQFLSQRQKKMKIEKEIEMEMDENKGIIHRKFQPSVSSSTVKKEKPLLYSASEVEYIN